MLVRFFDCDLKGIEDNTCANFNRMVLSFNEALENLSLPTFVFII